MSQLKQIFDSITPENIKDIPLIQTAMDIFVENLEKNSQISQKIGTIYDNADDENDSSHVRESKGLLRKGLLDVYLSSFYNVIKNAQNNDVVKAKIASSQVENAPFINDVKEILNDEYFITNKTFKEKIGTETSINYVYNLTNYLESSENSNDMNLYELKPFHFRTEGSIYKEMYENLVKPLAHPLGFTYVYNQIISESLQDLFGVDITYDISVIEMRNINGKIDIFTEDTDDSNVRLNTIGVRVNDITGEVFTEEDFNELITVHISKTVSEFSDEIVDDRIVRSLLFTDGTFLQQKTTPLEIIYVDYESYLSGYRTNIIDYNSSHWSLFIEYESDFEFQTSDKIDQFLSEITISNIKEENQGNYGQKYYNLTSGEFAFHVDGDQYSFAPGQDEVKNTYDDYDSINMQIGQSFEITVTGNSKIDELVTVKVSDDSNNFKMAEYIEPTEEGYFNATINTYSLNGDNYTVETFVTDSNNIDYYSKFRTDGLNNFNRIFGFSEVYDNYDEISNTLKSIGYGPVGRAVELVITDSKGFSQSNSGEVQADGTFEINLSLALFEAGDYRIDGTIFKANGKPEYTTFYESNNAGTRLEDIFISSNVFDYENSAPDWSSSENFTALIGDTSDMLGVDSSTPLILKKIGELAISGTYSEPDQNLLNYMIENNYTNFNQIDGIITNGSYIEGNDYDKSFQEYLEEQETFINYGRRVYPIDTSDFLIITSLDYASDDALIYSLSTTGYYLGSEEIDETEYYMYTNEGFYLTTLGDEV
jgi:hypothetical protein